MASQARVDDGNGPDSLLNMILEVTVERQKDKDAKTATAHTLGVSAATTMVALGRWAGSRWHA